MGIKMFDAFIYLLSLILDWNIIYIPGHQYQGENVTMTTGFSRSAPCQ